MPINNQRLPSRSWMRRLIFDVSVIRWVSIFIAEQIVKRTVDVAVSFVLLLFLLPLFFIVAFFIKVHDGGPVLYWQRRVGWECREFDFPKFRSMSINSDELRKALEKQNQHGSSSHTFKLKNDPRITPIGKIIRRFSIDELPQLWCVLKGEMTLVGPRPPLVSEVEKYTMAEKMRLMVKPGLTCIWQVNGRSDIPFSRQYQMDIEYMQQYSLWTDLKILLKTIPAIITGRGAY